MGAKQTKMEGTYLPATPILTKSTNYTQSETAMEGEIQNQNYDCGTNFNEQDPRSPHICRTPISIISTNLHGGAFAEQDFKMNQAESALANFRRKFFKGFTYNLNDPRSPGMHFDRSQICFDDSQDKVLNLDDTFADLFAETQARSVVAVADKLELYHNLEEATKNDEVKITQNEENDNHVDTSIEIEKREEELSQVVEEASVNEVEEIKEISKPRLSIPHTPTTLQNMIDPRSPTIGVDRTPIIFNDDDDDDDEATENVLLESILATLSLNMSDISVCSIGASNASSPTNPKAESTRYDRHGQLFRKIAHKRLRRPRVGNEKISLTTTHRLAKDVQQKFPATAAAQHVYENENTLPTSAKNVKGHKLKAKGVAIGVKRAPLSCLKSNDNVLHLRSSSKMLPAKALNLSMEQETDNDSLVLEP